MSLTTSTLPRVLFVQAFGCYERVLLSELSHGVGVK